MTTEEFETCTDLCINTTVAQRPGVTRVLTHGAHDGRVGLTDLFAGVTATIRNSPVFNYTFDIMSMPVLQAVQADLTWLESMVKRP